MKRRKKDPRVVAVPRLSDKQIVQLEEASARRTQDMIDQGEPTPLMARHYGEGPEGATCSTCRHFWRQFTLGVWHSRENGRDHAERVVKKLFICTLDGSRFVGHDAHPGERACRKFQGREDGEPMRETCAQQFLFGYDELLQVALEVIDDTTPVEPIKNAWGSVVGTMYRVAPQLLAKIRLTARYRGPE